MRLDALWLASLVWASGLTSFPAQTMPSKAGRTLATSDAYSSTGVPTTTFKVVPHSLRTAADDDGAEEQEQDQDQEQEQSPTSDTDNCEVQYEALKMLYRMKVDESREIEDELARVEKLLEAEKAKSANAERQYATCDNERQGWGSEMDKMKGQVEQARQDEKFSQESCLRDIVAVEDQMSELGKKTKQLQEEVERGPGPFPCNPQELMCRGDNHIVCRHMGCCT